MLNKLVCIFLFASIVFVSCEKEEGEGGTTTITGRVFAIDYNQEWTKEKGRYYAPGVDVFIIYGSDSIYSDKFKTGLGGWYRFQFMRPGKYTLYAFSRDKSQISITDEVVVMQTIEVKKKDKTVVVDDIEIYN